jgi:hypothetical protein
MAAKPKCEELERLRDEAKAALLQADRTHRFGHLTEAGLHEEARRKVDAMIQHLLVGHSGKPCPAGHRPIVQPVEPTREPAYDIFSGFTNKDAVWIEAVASLSKARRRMEEIARKSPGRYFLFSQETHSVVERIDTRNSGRSLSPRKSEG